MDPNCKHDHSGGGSGTAMPTIASGTDPFGGPPTGGIGGNSDPLGGGTDPTQLPPSGIAGATDATQGGGMVAQENPDMQAQLLQVVTSLVQALTAVITLMMQNPNQFNGGGGTNPPVDPSVPPVDSTQPPLPTGTTPTPTPTPTPEQPPVTGGGGSAPPIPGGTLPPSTLPGGGSPF